MWFIGVEVEQETSTPPPKKILDPPLLFNKSRSCWEAFVILSWCIMTLLLPKLGLFKLVNASSSGACNIKVSVSRLAVFVSRASGIDSVVYSFAVYKGIEPARRDLERALTQYCTLFRLVVLLKEHCEFAMLITFLFFF